MVKSIGHYNRVKRFGNNFMEEPFSPSKNTPLNKKIEIYKKKFNNNFMEKRFSFPKKTSKFFKKRNLITVRL